ncbi:MAG: FmdB family zinc ribbon protein [Candidatus Omnitrophota bacterium]
MPTYEYKCEACGHDFELFQSMTDKPLKECPECSGKVRRLIGAGSGIILKGSGFYQTDYKNSCPKSENKSTNDKKPSECSSCPHNKK